MHDHLIRATVLIAAVGLIALPGFAHRGQRAAPVAKSRKGLVERLILALVTLGFVLPLIWIATPFLAMADYPQHDVQYIIGVACYVAGLTLLYWSHRSLGESWSISLELREAHRLVTHGAYARIRHPMYFALLLYGLGQALVLPNWIAGPSYLIATSLLVALRLVPEERMMREAFDDYRAYADRTARIIPGVW